MTLIELIKALVDSLDNGPLIQDRVSDTLDMEVFVERSNGLYMSIDDVKVDRKNNRIILS